MSQSYEISKYYETHTGTRLSAIYISQYIQVKNVYFNKTIQHRMASEREHYLGSFASWNLNTSYRTWPHFYNMFITYTCKHWKLAVALSCTGSFHAGPRCSRWQQSQLHDGHSAPVNDNDSTMTSSWARLRLKSPASLVFTQPFIPTQIKENSKAPRHWPLCGEFTMDRWIPHTNGQLCGKRSIWWSHHETKHLNSAIEQKIKI